MTTDNSERIKAAADELADEIVAVLRAVADSREPEPLTFDVREHWGKWLHAQLTEHFGESAPEQKEGNVATIYAEGRWIHARCLLCEWGGVRWEAKKGSHLPNAKAILQHALRDHLLAAHVGKFAPNPPCPQCEMEKSGEQIGLRHHECADEPLPAPSVDTNAERKPECEVRNINGEICGRAHATSEHAEWSKAIREAAAVLAVTPPADAPQEPTCAHTARRQNDPRCPTCGEPLWPVVESSVLPSKSERE